MNVIFEIHYRAHYGQALYIVGSAPEIGSWNPSRSIRLKWGAGDIWSLQVDISDNPLGRCEYKYFVSSYETVNTNDEIRWENSENREIIFERFIEKKLFEYWDYPFLTEKSFKLATEIEKKVEENNSAKINLVEKIFSGGSNVTRTTSDPTPVEKANGTKDLLELTAITLNSTRVERRFEKLEELCKSLDSVVKVPPPNKDSLALCPSARNVVEALKKVGASNLFMETTQKKEIESISKQIENVTGINPITGERRNLTELKMSCPELKDSTILKENAERIVEAVKRDLASLYGIPSEEVVITYIVPGSIEILFTLPEKVQALNIDSQSLPTFNTILKSQGVPKYNINQQSKFPDPIKAKKMFEDYTKPLLIKTEANGSQLMEKFGQYIPVLASLSTQVRVIHNKETNSLEIHGPPDAKGSVLAYFAEIEEALQGAKVKEILIVPISLNSLNTEHYFSDLWWSLFTEAKKFALSHISYTHKLQNNTIRMNPNLTRGEPVGQKFINALTRTHGNPSSFDPKQILSDGVFGWHGTKTAEAVLNIAINNLDPGRRNYQVYGPGEYSAENASYSQSGYWGNTNTLFLLFIIKNKNPYFKNESSIYIINNPLSKDCMYMVPILIATFNNQTPLPLERSDFPPTKTFDAKWEWKNDDGWTLYGAGQPTGPECQLSIEECYNKFKEGNIIGKIKMTFVRLNNGITDSYELCFISMKQKNLRTSYIREIRRI